MFKLLTSGRCNVKSANSSCLHLIVQWFGTMEGHSVLGAANNVPSQFFMFVDTVHKNNSMIQFLLH